MEKRIRSYLFLIGAALASFNSYAQKEGQIDVEQSAEVFLEEYSDNFQENFFEALKQKGIENYDKAINLLLNCKRIAPKNDVINYQLAKVHIAEKKPYLAQEYAIAAVTEVPENLWYVQTLMDVLKKQGLSISDIKSSIPFKNEKLQENLAIVYYRQKEYKKALKTLNGIKKSAFTEELSHKIKDSIENRTRTLAPSPQTVDNSKTAQDPLTGYRVNIEKAVLGKNYTLLQKISQDALERYPLQPYFYFANGLALNKKAEHKNAIEVLENGLDYLLNDITLANKIYKELADAYNALNNTPKANMYLRKIKTGS